MARDMFGTALDLDPVRVHRRAWWPFQPRNVVMAPDGHIWFHPDGGLWRDDYAVAPLRLQALFVHELTHVWQHQRGLFLPLRRHPFCRYAYRLKDGRMLRRYGIEQQAMIVEHAFLAKRRGQAAPQLAALLTEAGLG
ncbi:vgr related protein [uncultured Sphingomonas sp.]|uniref:vgr related protein n=1 Tax=uncultured Sphingomonas sp. TaxID=158754 RepID=UPI0025D41E74|nr:vgr related protein [uncultured Sphingomonas sp.]